MARRGNKKFTPAEKQRRQAQRYERDRLDAIADLTEQLTCLDSVAREVADDCTTQVTDLEFDLATSRLAIEIWADHPAAQEAIAILTELEQEHQRHCAALTAIASRLNAVANVGANHVHLRPLEPYRKLVEERLYPPAAPPS